MVMDRCTEISLITELSSPVFISQPSDQLLFISPLLVGSEHAAFLTELTRLVGVQVELAQSLLIYLLNTILILTQSRKRHACTVLEGFGSLNVFLVLALLDLSSRFTTLFIQGVACHHGINFGVSFLPLGPLISGIARKVRKSAFLSGDCYFRNSGR